MAVTSSFPSSHRPVSVPSLRRPLSSAGTTVLTCVSVDNGGSAVSEAGRRYEAARQSRPVDWQQLDSIVDKRARGPFTQRHAHTLTHKVQLSHCSSPSSRVLCGCICSVRLSNDLSGLDDLFPLSGGSGVLVQPAWNDSTAADWNARLPYSGQDALAQSLLTSQGSDEEEVEQTGPLTAQYRQHIRRASLDTRTLYERARTASRSPTQPPFADTDPLINSACALP